MKSRRQRLTDEDIKKIADDIKNPKEEPKLGKAKPVDSSWSGVTFGNPRKGCKKCYGRGYIGKNTETGMPIMCSCSSRKRNDSEQPSRPRPPQIEEREGGLTTDQELAIRRSNIAFSRTNDIPGKFVEDDK